MTNDKGALRRPQLWLGLGLPVSAWVLHLTVSYAVTATACHAAGTLVHVLTLGLLAAAVGGGWMAWTSVPARGDGAHAQSDRRAQDRFLALAGTLAAGLFALAIFTQGLPAVILDACL